ncbi:COG1470 family protein [Psychroserpens luteus]|uniref:Uncharacterized protein n=1 Tax=Psychroserpens luteus TaxID=1434066 RepID=A0ABW5ZMD7_9FLAO|nr:hypothetical protein [Psychroserpens luteus]
MITITSENSQEKIKIVEKEIILNGSPSNLNGHIQLVNQQKEVLRVKTLALVDKNNKRTNTVNGSDFIRVSARLNPGEQKLMSINHTLPSITPPGTYEHYMMIGSQMHKVKMIVQPTLDIVINPSTFTFLDSTPGKKHTAVLTLTNTGNIPFQVPVLKHGALLDMDLMCRAFGMGFREKGVEGFMSSLDEVSKNVKSHLTDWVSVSVDEFGQIVQPGESIIVHANFITPKNADAKNDYEGDFRFWNKEISIIIKSHIENIKTKGNGKAK